MGISKTGVSRSITKEDLDAMYKQGFVDAAQIYEEKLKRIVQRLEEENKRLKKLKNGFIALSDHEVCDIENQAYDFCIGIVREEGVLNNV